MVWHIVLSTDSGKIGARWMAVLFRVARRWIYQKDENL